MTEDNSMHWINFQTHGFYLISKNKQNLLRTNFKIQGFIKSFRVDAIAKQVRSQLAIQNAQVQPLPCFGWYITLLDSRLSGVN